MNPRVVDRIDCDDYFSLIAAVVGRRSTCSRRRVGCVLVDIHGHIIATGYNGVPKNFPHCIDHPCPGANCPSGTGLELCEAIHAEANALLQCSDVFKIVSAYVTASPCVHCVKLLLNTSCQEIVFAEEYPHTDSRDLWIRGGRIWRQHSLDIASA